MNVEDAAHRIAHEFPGGIAPLAERMGIGKVVFSGKVNPNDKGHLLGLVESVRMQQLAGRYDVLYAMADELGHVCIATPQVSDAEVSTLLTRTCAEFGDYLREIERAMSDNKVTPNEVKRLQKELLELVAAATRLQAKLATMSRTGR